MDLQQQTPTPRRRRTERPAETPHPTETTSNAELTEKVRAAGEREVAETKHLIDLAARAIDHSKPEQQAFDEELRTLEQEVDEAWGELEEKIQKEVTIKKNPEHTAVTLSHLEDILSKNILPFIELQKLLQDARQDEAIKEAVHDTLVSIVGIKYTDLLLEHDLLARLEGINKQLEHSSLSEEPVIRKRDLKNLIAIHETLGDHIADFLRALDFHERDAAFEIHDPEILSVMNTEFDTLTGECCTAIQLNVQFRHPKILDGSAVTLLRTLRRQTIPDTQEPQMLTIKKRVEHNEFKLAPALEGRGLAAQILRDSLAVYIDLSIDDIYLQANIEIGGYAWAVYGYGWETDDLLWLHKFKKIERGETITPDSKQLLHEALREIVYKNTQNFLSVINDIRQRGGRLPADEILATLTETYEALSKNPQVTPQDLALVGINGPKFIKTENGEWYWEEEWPEAKANGEVAAPGFSHGAHAGKIGMLGTSWPGKIELKKDGEQQGKNLQLLQDALQRRTTSR